MNLLIDTNVILDILLKRKPYYQNARRLISLSGKEDIYCYISASAVTDIFYIARKELKSKEVAIDLLNDLLKTINIASVTGNSIYEAIELKWYDFEDSIQYVVGKSVFAQYIITRNLRDFSKSQIEIKSPEQFLDLIISKN